MEIPKACFDPKLSSMEIRNLMRPSYLSEEQIKRTAGSDDWMEKLSAEMRLECLLEIDADAIYMINSMRGDVDG